MTPAKQGFLQAPGPRTEYTCCPECHRSSRQRQDRSRRLQSKNAPVSQEYIDLCNCERRQRRPTGRKQQRDRRPGSQEHGGPDRSKKTFSQGQSPQKWRDPWGAKPCRCAAGGQDQTQEGEGHKDRSLLPQTTSRRNTNQRGKSRERSKQKTRTQSRLSSGARRPVGRAGP